MIKMSAEVNIKPDSRLDSTVLINQTKGG